MDAIRLENLTKYYGKKRGIDGITLTVPLETQGYAALKPERKQNLFLRKSAICLLRPYFTMVCG